MSENKPDGAKEISPIEKKPVAKTGPNKNNGKAKNPQTKKPTSNKATNPNPNANKNGQSKPKTKKPQNKPKQEVEGEKPSPVKKAAAPKKPGNKNNQRRHTNKKKGSLKIIPLGGLGEVGKNIMVYESGNDIIVVDCGLAFPNDEMLGVDIVLPDFSYLIANADKVRAIIITHGHEDHIGGLAYLLKNINAPVYATKLTMGLIEGKLQEHKLLAKAKLNVVKAGDTIKVGCFEVEFIHVNHSIPDACALAINTPAGMIVMTGDFKVDYTPIDGKVADLAKFGELGTKGVLALLSDSTNSEKPGSNPSERTVGASFERIFAQAGKRRIIVATFASNVHRVQQVINTAAEFGRKVAVSGRSMVNVSTKALELGYLHDPKKTLIDFENIGDYTDEQIVIVTTGSQGEPMAALSRMASGDHRQLEATPNDLIIISATPIPGNEKSVGTLVDDLMQLGVEVVYERDQKLHVSGHACQDEQKLMLALTKPKYFIPVHGEFKHLTRHADLGLGVGIPKENILIGENGTVFETDGNTFRISGQVQTGSIMVDGLGVGDVGSVVLRDRKHLSEDGLIVVAVTIERESGKIISGPDVVSRGFVYVKESAELMKDARRAVTKVLEKCEEGNITEWGEIRNRLRNELSYFIYKRTKRKPMILPVIMQI